MPDSHNTIFATAIGCMDGRVQTVVTNFGKEEFNADCVDTITEAGLDGLLTKVSDPQLLVSITKKLLISVDNHKSKGIIVHGHEDCAGNPVNEKQHKEDIAVSVKKIKELLSKKKIPVIGVYIKVTPKIVLEKI